MTNDDRRAAGRRLSDRSDAGASTVQADGESLSLRIQTDAGRDFRYIEALLPMRWAFKHIVCSIKHLAGDQTRAHPSRLWRVSAEELEDLAFFLAAGLQDYSLEFYLIRRDAADDCKKQRVQNNTCEAPTILHPCRMKPGSGFRRLAGIESDPSAEKYGYSKFLEDSGHHFQAIHSHMVCVQRTLAELYRTVLGLPFAGFTPSGKREMLRLCQEWSHLMRRILVATHLQTNEPEDAGGDVPAVLTSALFECDKFLRSIGVYHESHRERTVNLGPPGIESTETSAPCIPASAGVIQRLIDLYRNLAGHARELSRWGLQLYSVWYPAKQLSTRLLSQG